MKISSYTYRIISIIILCFCMGCSGEKTDEYLLEADRKVLNESLYSTKVHTYKLGKICIRASIEKDTISAEFRVFKSKLDHLFQTVVLVNKGNPQSLGVMDYIAIYKDYKAMNGFIEKTDEDIFPTLTEALNIAYGNGTASPANLLKGPEKIKMQNMEHAVLSAMVMLSSDMGKEISLYECAKTNPDLMEDSEVKSLLQFFRGFIFWEKKLLYLSEHELTRNIDWLNKNKQMDLPVVKAAFRLQNSSPQEVYLYYHSLNYLFRALDRMTMDREIDSKRSMEDLQIFLDNSRKLGLSNELTWAVETYVYVKQEEHEKAIVSLNKLKTSPLLTDEDKKEIAASVAYLQQRKKGAALNRVSDKYFLGKIAGKYMYQMLSAIEWQQLLEENKVPHAREILGTINAFRDLAGQVRKYTDGSNLKETGKDLQETGKGLFEKGKDLLK